MHNRCFSNCWPVLSSVNSVLMLLTRERGRLKQLFIFAMTAGKPEDPDRLINHHLLLTLNRSKSLPNVTIHLIWVPISNQVFGLYVSKTLFQRLGVERLCLRGENRFHVLSIMRWSSSWDYSGLDKLRNQER